MIDGHQKGTSRDKSARSGQTSEAWDAPLSAPFYGIGTTVSCSRESLIKDTRIIMDTLGMIAQLGVPASSSHTFEV
jgi:hypothetical protein